MNKKNQLKKIKIRMINLTQTALIVLKKLKNFKVVLSVKNVIQLQYTAKVVLVKGVTSIKSTIITINECRS